MMKIEDTWKSLNTGQIVSWNGRTYVVSEHSNVEEGWVRLIPFDNSPDVKPSLTWPQNPEKNVTSIRLLAWNMDDFLGRLAYKVSEIIEGK